VDLVYAVVEATSTSQNHRCLAEMQNLWRQLRATNPGARMVVTILRRRWPARELLDLYQRPPAAAIGEGGRRYRVVVVDLDRGGRQTAVRLAAGRWSEIRVRRLQPFEELARPIGVRRRPAVADDRRAGPVDEYAYLDVGGGQVQVAPMPAAWPFVDMGIEWADDGDETSAAGDGGSRLASHEGGNATDDVPGPGRGVS
jgi:hypothetical protein